MSRPAWKRNSRCRTAAIAASALILYPLAISLPMLTIQKFGHTNQSSILDGIIKLLANGHIVVGGIVLLCSVVFPLGKLVALLVVTLAGPRVLGRRRGAITYRIIEWTGRWGMLDVLLVAILVAALKLGDWVQVTPGPAALAFTLCVVLSLLATASFDPRRAWNEDR